MGTVKVREARQNVAEVIDAACSEAVVLEVHGPPAAVLISPEFYERLLGALEESEDVAALDAALVEEGDNIPWEQVRALPPFGPCPSSTQRSRLESRGPSHCWPTIPGRAV